MTRCPRTGRFMKSPPGAQAPAPRIPIEDVSDASHGTMFLCFVVVSLVWALVIGGLP